jgi:hypothetical protein
MSAIAGVTAAEIEALHQLVDATGLELSSACFNVLFQLSQTHSTPSIIHMLRRLKDEKIASVMSQAALPRDGH